MVEHGAIERAITDFWWEVDRNLGRQACAYFTEDAYFDLGGKPLVGHEAIAGFYTGREARGPRTTRHLVQNFQVRPVSPDEATALYLMAIYGADGEPVHPAALPILLCDVEDRLVRREDGRWLIAEHRLIALFEGGMIVRPS